MASANINSRITNSTPGSSASASGNPSQTSASPNSFYFNSLEAILDLPRLVLIILPVPDAIVLLYNFMLLSDSTVALNSTNTLTISPFSNTIAQLV